MSDLSNANNHIIKRGFELTWGGVLQLSFLDIISGVLLSSTFIASNFFMALLVIGAIFTFGMALVLYPFQVLTWVAKAKPGDGWLDFWPAFDGIIKSLQKLIVVMIACAFILVINIAIVRALGIDVGLRNNMNFGDHSLIWISVILTFFLMFEIFKRTREQLDKYVGKDAGKLYENVKKDANTSLKNINTFARKTTDAIGWTKKKK